jgi:AAA domain/DnaA N-terminal domain
MSDATQNPCASDLWPRVLAHVQNNVSPQCFDTWFRPIVFAGCNDGVLRAIVPSLTFKQCLLENYSAILHEAIANAANDSLRFELEVFVQESQKSASVSADLKPALTVVKAAALETSANRQPWLVEGLWTAAAVGVIGGQPKAGKTTLALDMAVSVASASPCLGVFPVHTPGPVLLYAAEESPAALRTRLETIARLRGLDFAQLDVRVIVVNSLRLDRSEDQERLDATVMRHRPALLILDPLIRIHMADENASGDIAALLGYLRALQRKSGAAVAIVHHVRKQVSSSAGAGYSLRGSSDLYAWLDSFLYLRKHRDQLTLSAEHRSAPPLGPLQLELASDPDAGVQLKMAPPVDPEAVAAADPLLSRIMLLLANAREPCTVEALRAKLQVRNQRVVAALRQLCTEGKVQRLAHGYAAVADQPAQKTG